MPAAEAQTIDRYLLIQPIQVCNDAGANCAAITNFPAETRAIYAQAGIFPVFLTPTQFNSTAMLTGITGVDVIDGDGDGGSETVIEAWFVQSISVPSGTLYGEAWLDGNGLLINSGAVANFNGGNGRRDTFAHEIGHNLGLLHTADGDPNNLMTAGATRNIPTGVGDINPNGAQVDQLAAAQITEMRNRYVQAASVCNDGTPGNDGITKNSGVCDKINGLGGDDSITLEGTAVVENDVTGDGGTDIIIVRGDSSVLGNIHGGDGTDTITVTTTGQIGGQADSGKISGGAGADTIEINALVLGNVFGDVDDGVERVTDGDDRITLLGGSIGGSIFGQRGNDTITVQGGTVGTDLLGGAGNDQLTVSGGTVSATLNGGAGDDTLLVSGGTVGNGMVGLAGKDKLTISGGAVTGNMSGGADNDELLVSGGSLDGDMLGADGDDTLTVSGGIVTGDMLSAAGKDKLTISGTGNVTGNMSGGADNDELLISGGVLTGDMLGAAGIDKLTVSGGTLTGNMNAGTEDDELLVSGGTVTGYMFGNTGKDKLTITGGTVKGDMDGGADDDELRISAGSVEDSMLGGTGADKLTVEGTGEIDIDVDGGDGDDTIQIFGTGKVGGKVIGGSGKDDLKLTGGTVAQNVETGADDDKIDLNGTAISGDVLAGAGADTMTWKSGTVAAGKSVDMGADTDRLDIYGTAAAGTALQSALASLDGGDDAASADGQVDTLNLHGVVETLTQMNNWEFINLVGNSRGDLGTASRTITTEIFAIDATSSLIAGAGVGGEVYRIAGILDNKGGLAMSDGVAFYDEVAVSSDYRATAGALASFDTFLGADASPSDLLRVGGATTGDPTGLVIFDTNLGAGAYTPLGIELVRVEGPTGGTAAEDFFLTAGPIEKGLWTYDLGLDDTRANPGRANADVHVLYSRPDEITQFTPYFATAALSIFETSLEPWSDRQHTLQDTLATNRQVTPTADIGQPVPVKGTFVDLWATPFGIYRETKARSGLSFFGDSFSARMDYDQTVWGLVGGVDVISILEGDAAVMGGLFGGYLSSTLSPDAVAVSGDYEGGTVGAYGSYLWQGLTLSAVAKADLLKFGWDSSSLNIKENADVDTWGGRVEAAYKIALGEAPWLEPYGSLSYARSSWDKFSVLGTEFDLDGNESFVGRLGLRIGADFYGNTEYARIFAGAGVAEQFEDGSTADIVSGGATLPLSDDIDDTALEVLGGFKFGGMESGLSIALAGTGQFSDSVEAYGGKATLNYQF